METEGNIIKLVKWKYEEIALQDKQTSESSCCGSGVCSTELYNITSDDYTDLNGYNVDADLGLGWGLPICYWFMAAREKSMNIFLKTGMKKV